MVFSIFFVHNAGNLGEEANKRGLQDYHIYITYNKVAYHPSFYSLFSFLSLSEGGVVARDPRPPAFFLDSIIFFISDSEPSPSFRSYRLIQSTTVQDASPEAVDVCFVSQRAFRLYPSLTSF